MRLRDGTEVTNPRLGRCAHFDPLSANYPIRELVTLTRPRSYTWSCSAHLNQGQEPNCVGFAWAHGINARPGVHPIDRDLATRIYRRAQELDVWPGADYVGTSVLAGAKAVQELHYLAEYRWAFGLDDAIMAIGHHGPAVLGINWYEGMFHPDSDGVIHPTGWVAGGHAILARAVSISTGRVLLRNSWSTVWGLGGECLIGFDDLGRLLEENGECCVPVVRKRPC